MMLIYRNNKVVWALLFGTTLALATHVRPISYYLILPAIMWVILYAKFLRWQWKIVFISATCIIIPWIILIGGWQFRNFLITGSSEFSHIKGINLMGYTANEIVALRDKIPLSEATDKLFTSFPSTEDLSQGKLHDLYMQKALSVIKQNPLLFIRVKIDDVIEMMVAPGAGPFLGYLGKPTNGGMLGDIYRLSLHEYINKWVIEMPIQFIISIGIMTHLFVIYIGSILSLKQVTKGSKEVIAIHAFLLAIIFYFTVLIPEGDTRFRIPIMPLLSIYGAIGLYYGVSLVRHFTSSPHNSINEE